VPSGKIDGRRGNWLNWREDFGTVLVGRSARIEKGNVYLTLAVIEMLPVDFLNGRTDPYVMSWRAVFIGEIFFRRHKQ
jgi:hypothetical protein